MTIYIKLKINIRLYLFKTHKIKKRRKYNHFYRFEEYQ